MEKLRWWIISFAVILMYTLYSGHSRASENEPVREPVYESPRVYTNSNKKVMFKEFFEGLTVNRIEFFDPDSEKLLYGVSLKDGRLAGKRDGSGMGENDGPFDESGSIVEHIYYTNSGKTLLVTWEYNGELVGYKALGRGMKIPLIVSVDLEKGRIKRARRNFILNNETVDFKRNYGPDTYEETYFHNDGTEIIRKYKSEFLQIERHVIPAKGRGSLVPYSAHYLRGKHAFTVKNKYNKDNFIKEVAIFDADDKLVSKANHVFGERLYLKEETVNGRKGFQVIFKGQDGIKKVEAMKFEDE